VLGADPPVGALFICDVTDRLQERGYGFWWPAWSAAESR